MPRGEFIFLPLSWLSRPSSLPFPITTHQLTSLTVVGVAVLSSFLSLSLLSLKVYSLDIGLLT